MPGRRKGLPAVPTKEDDEQAALDGMDACHLSFVGMAIDGVAQAPALDHRVVLKVTAICCAEPSRERLRTGATRVRARMRVEAVEVMEGPTAPENGPNLFDQQAGEGGE